MNFINSNSLIKTLDERQKEIYQMLEINQEKSGIAYLGAIRVLKDNMNPDRFHQAANSIRHIGALITRSKKGKKSSKKPKQQQFSKKLKAELTEETQFLHQDIIKNIQDLIDRWQNLQSYFVPIAHYSKKDFSEFEENFENFENIIVELLKTSNDRKKILEFLLKIENPMQKHVVLLKSAILFPTDNHYFFTNLTSPDWFEILKDNKFFNDPAKKFSKYFTISSWPQANYLISISQIKSREVLEVFSNFKDFENYIIFRRLLQCVLNMSIESAKNSIRLINTWARNYMTTLELNFLKKLLVKFIEKAELHGALQLIEIMFNFNYPKIKTENYPQFNKYFFLLDSKFDVTNQIILNIRDGDFQSKFIHILCRCLSEAIRSEIIKYVKIDEDINGVKTQVNPELLLLREHSEILRQSVRVEPDTQESNNIINILINSIRDYTLALFSLDPKAFKKCIKLFLKFRWKIFTRLFLFMLDNFYDFLKADLSIILAKKEIFNGTQCWHEYFHLLKNNFSKFTQDEKKVILYWIEEGPEFNVLEKNFSSKDEFEEFKSHFINSWRKIRLNPIIDYIPEEFKKKFNTLLAEAKILKDPDYLRKRTGISIYNPVDSHLKDIKDMNIDDQINHLKNFKSNEESFPFKGKEGLGRAYSILIKEKPSKYNKLIQDFKNIPTEYLSDVIDGFKNAMDEDDRANLDFLLNIFNAIIKFLESIEEKDIVHEIQFAIAQFIEVMLNKTSIETIIENQELIWSLILQSFQAKVVDFKKYSDSKSYHNTPFSYYFYTLKGLTIDNMIVFIDILHHDSKKEEEIPLLNLFYQKIDELLDLNLLDGELIRAILGYRLNSLLRINENWTQERLDLIFTNDKARRSLWDVAWDSFVLTHRFSTKIFALLKSQYKRGINRLKSTSPNISFDGRQSLINHLTNAYLIEVEDLDKDSLIEYLFLNSNSEMRKLVWQILSSFLEHINKIGDNEERKIISKRYFDLLNHRVKYLQEKRSIEYEDLLTELDPFGIIFSRIQELNKEHLILLNNILELTEGNSGIFTMKILEKIKESIEIDHSVVLEILNKLVSSKNQTIWLDERTSEIIFDIISILKIRGSSLQSKLVIKKIIEAMWKRGYHIFSELE